MQVTRVQELFEVRVTRNQGGRTAIIRFDKQGAATKFAIEQYRKRNVGVVRVYDNKLATGSRKRPKSVLKARPDGLIYEFKKHWYE